MTNSIFQHSFTQFADAFLEMHRQGKTLTIEEAISAFPHLEQDIRTRLPALLVLEKTLQRKHPFPEPNDPNPHAGCYLGEIVGRGSHGVVYRAYQPDLDREIAVKAIQLDPDDSTQKRFEQECKAMARLEHANVVPIYGYDKSEDHAFLLMKLIEGHSLSSLLAGETDYRGAVQLARLRSDWQFFAQVALQIVQGLKHAHLHNMVHRDIKPSNLLLEESGRIWITDFGLAKLHDLQQSLSRTGDVIGTPLYMSPEQLRGKCDERSDIYSLGLTLFELATGRSGRILDSNDDAVGVHSYNKEVPAELAKVIEKAAAFVPEDRYQSMDELEVVLVRYLEGQTPDRRKGRRKPDHVFRKEYRRKMAVSIATSVAVFSIGAILWSIWGNPSAPGPQQNQPLARFEAVGSAFDKVFNGLETGSLDRDAIAELAGNYKNSGLSLGFRVSRLRTIISNSTLSDSQKVQAQEVITKLSNAAVAKLISREDVEYLIGRLVPNRDLTLDRVNSMRLGYTAIGPWLQEVETKVKPFADVKVDLKSQIESVVKDLSPETARTLEEDGVTDLIHEFANQDVDQIRKSVQSSNINPAQVREKVEKSGILRERPDLRSEYEAWKARNR